jgi:NAD(P)H-dependent FMN reductase
MGLRISVIYGSVRSERQGIKAARFIERKFSERGHDVTLVDPLEHRLPLLDYMYKEYEEGEAPEAIEKLGRIISGSDSFVIVTGEYNHSVPPALKNLLDHYQGEYFFKPSSIACYSAGPFGGVRAAVHLRAIMAELGSPSLPTLFPVSAVQDAFRDNGTPLEEAYERRIVQFIEEHEWYAYAMKEKREQGTPY